MLPPLSRSRTHQVTLLRSTCALALVIACGGAEFKGSEEEAGGTGVGAGGVGGHLAGGSSGSNRGGRSDTNTAGASIFGGSSGQPANHAGSSITGGSAGRSEVGGIPSGTSGASLGGTANAAGSPDIGADAGSGGADAGEGGIAAGGATQGGAEQGGSSATAGSSEGGATAGAGAGGTSQGGTSTGGNAGGGSATAGTGGKGCPAVDWFPDHDGDGYGRSSGKIVACLRPTSGKWVSLGGDCNDDNATVLPDPLQTDFSSSSYTTPEGGESFDYDCSGSEESDPTQLGSAPACGGVLSVLDCTSKPHGFVATDRTGPGINPLCGSNQVLSCVASGINCVASIQELSDEHRCR